MSIEMLFTNTYEQYCNRDDYWTAYNELIYKPVFGKVMKKCDLSRNELTKREKAMHEVIQYFNKDFLTFNQVKKIMMYEYRIKHYKNKKSS